MQAVVDLPADIETDCHRGVAYVGMSRARTRFVIDDSAIATCAHPYAASTSTFIFTPARSSCS